MMEPYSEFDYPDDVDDVDVSGEMVMAQMVEALKVFGGFINEAKTLNGVRLRNWAVWRVICPTVINHETQCAFAARVGVSKSHVQNYVTRVRKIKARVEAGDLGIRRVGR